ncbi:hypothetical protein [Beijerinckia sp. L45]|uniref:hypothetical protein n=1 Tax=Beijerinckia sp. L45 TaxID=1641855 RepID=UPI00131D6FB7|nr:hypothetical protein [Beijerinckia sp. L45]
MGALAATAPTKTAADAELHALCSSSGGESATTKKLCALYGVLSGKPAKRRPPPQTTMVSAAQTPGDGATDQDDANRFNEQTKYRPPAKDAQDPCAKRLFFRSDPLADYHYLVDLSPSPQGASVAFTDDERAATKSLTVNGRASYVLTGDACPRTDDPHSLYTSGYAFALFTSANGNWSEPRKATERSALKFGADAEAEFANVGPIDIGYLSASPFFQSDFRGTARVYGGTFAAEPQVGALNLGVVRHSFDVLDFWWQVRPQATFAQVDTVGLTNYRTGFHPFLGAIVRANFNFFPSTGGQWPSWLADRLAFVATASLFSDVGQRAHYDYYTAQLQYKLPGYDPASVTTISLEYDRGTDIETLSPLNQYLVKLSYAY